MGSRFGLDFKKLYHDFEGGYDIQKLTKVLQRIKSDHRQGFHPFVDPEGDKEVMYNLQKVLKSRV